MKKKLNHIPFLFLLAAFSLPLALPAFLQLQKLNQQWQMLEQLETIKLTSITVKTNSILWINKGKECLINGELFDVKTKNVLNDQTVLTGLYDSVEKEIKKNLEDYTKNQQHSKKLQQLIKLFSITVSEKEKVFYFSQVKINHSAFFIHSIYRTPFPDHTSPPPKPC